MRSVVVVFGALLASWAPWALAFDGNGPADLVIGVPWEAIGSAAAAGAVNVLYGSVEGGLTAIGSQLWDESDVGVEVPEYPEALGSALATADFNGDGHEDVAIGVPYEQVGLFPHAGAVVILYGGEGGLSAAGGCLMPNYSPTHYERLGSSLAAGDFNGDGYDDLVAGAPWDKDQIHGTVGGISWAMGSADGLQLNFFNTRREWLWDCGACEEGNEFGTGLAAGDFDGDGLDDLAIGAPGAEIDGWASAGRILVGYGSAVAPLDFEFARGACFDLAEDGWGVQDNRRLGEVLATGDLNGDGRDDLGIGMSRFNLQGGPEAGMAAVLFGSASGLTVDGMEAWAQWSSGDTSEPYDHYGAALAFGDFDGDGYDDLAVGVPDEDLEGSSTIGDAGMVSVRYGSAAGLDPTRFSNWTQASMGISGDPQALDEFGLALAAGDFDTDGRDDLAIGIPGDVVSDLGGAGSVAILYGTSAGLTGTGAQLWSQNSVAVPGTAEANDRFGAALAASRRAITSPAPTPTPGPGTIGVMLEMPEQMFHPGDDCFLRAHRNNSGAPLTGVPFVVILDVYGSYWFYPAWTHEVAWVSRDLPTGTSTEMVIPAFVWPATGTGTASGIVFWGALLDSAMTAVLGGEVGIGRWEFGYGP